MTWAGRVNLDTHEPKRFGPLGVEDFHEPLVFRSKCDLARTTDHGPAVCLTPLATINCSLDRRLACQLDENSLRSGGLPQAPPNIRASSRSKRLRNTSCRVPPKGIAVISIGSLGLRSRRSEVGLEQAGRPENRLLPKRFDPADRDPLRDAGRSGPTLFLQY